MELKGSLATQIVAKRANAERERQLHAENQRKEEQARKARQAEIDRRLLPFRLVERLFADRLNGASQHPADSKHRRGPDVYLHMAFPLKSVELEGKTYEAALVIDSRKLDDVNTSWEGTPKNLGLRLTEGGSMTEHSLATIHSPILDRGMPEDYGFRTYTRSEKDSYEVSSYSTRGEEAETIIVAIKEAAELAGIFTPDATGSTSA